MKLGFGICKLVGALIVFSFALVGSLISCLGNFKLPEAKVKSKKDKGSWWDYDRNTLDNDIEQIRHVDGIEGKLQ